MAPIHTILHPTDFSTQSAYALRLACSLARDYGARLVVLHVFEEPAVAYGEGVMLPPAVDFVEESREQLRHLPIPADDVRAERRFERGDAVDQILRVAGDMQADLIVMGTHGRTGLARLLMGSVAERVVRNAPCPVLTLKTPLTEEVEVLREEAMAASV
jgi:nucleotide-binding universal stress UspA family protein